MQSLSFVPPLLPEEHYFSRIARIAFLMQYKSYSKFYEKLFALTKPLKPSWDVRLTYEQTSAVLKDTHSDHLIKHTPLGFFRHFINFNRWMMLYHGQLKCRKYAQFIPPLSNLKHKDSWRTCPRCIDEDTIDFGTPYWHTSHQLITAKRCYRHADQTLISYCTSCHWVNTDLRKHPLPTLSCPTCGHDLSKSNEPSNRAIEAIQHIGQNLHEAANSTPKCTTRKIKLPCIMFQIQLLAA